MRYIKILLILVISNLASFAYEEQRLPAATSNRYPVLEELEVMIYPKQNFYQENPGLRLERLEIGILGDKQRGSIQERLSRLQNETHNWQIARTPTLKQYRKKSLAKSSQYYPIRQAYSGTIGLSQTRNTPRQKDYDYLNYRLVTPIIQNIGRQGVLSMFRKKK